METMKGYRTERHNMGKVWIAVLILMLGITFLPGMNRVQAAETLAKPVLVSVKGVTDTSARLTWKKVENASGYRVYKKAYGGSWTIAGTVYNGATVTYTDNGLTRGQRYYYTVAAFQNTAAGIVWSSRDPFGLTFVCQYSSVYPFKYTASHLKAYKPSMLPATEIGKSSILVKWKLLRGLDGYRIYRREEGGLWKTIKIYYNGENYYYLDNDVVPGTKYYYTVRGYKRYNGTTVYSSYNATGSSCTAAATMIKSVQSATPYFNAMENGGKVKITIDSVKNADGYRIYRKEPGGIWKTVKTLGGNSNLTYTDSTGLVIGKQYTYTVKAYLKGGSKAYWSKYDKTGTSVLISGLDKIIGADLSFWNGEINFAKAKQDLEFVILREGYGTKKDIRFNEYVNGARANNIPIHGVYHFCYSINEKEVLKEAQSCINNVRLAGLGYDTIIFFDFEYDTVDDAEDRGVELGKEECTRFTEVFCQYVESQGYRAGVYYNVDYRLRMYNMNRISKYVQWLASWNEGKYPGYPCTYHQFAADGKVRGISGPVDLNILYK